MKNIKRWLYRFMYGRYGNDKLNNCLLWVYIGLLLLQMVLMLLADASIAIRVIYRIVSILSLAVAFTALYRSFSRNIAKRRRENEKLLNFLKLMAAKKRDRKTHVYRKCPKCHAVLRLPKAKGKHTVVCPRCHERFEVRG